MGMFAHQQIVGTHGNAPFLQAVHFLDQYGRVHDHAVADDTELAGVKYPGRDQMADEQLPLYHHGMAGIVSPLKAGHHVTTFGQYVHDLALAFISPLGSYDNDIRHTPLPLFGQRFESFQMKIL
jgi:hypothetical protein